MLLQGSSKDFIYIFEGKSGLLFPSLLYIVKENLEVKAELYP